MNHRVYLDDNATTAIGPEALAAFTETLRTCPGNPSSLHREGIESRLVLERSRRTIERLLDAPRDTFVFTGSGSEANALGVLGALDARTETRPRVVSTAVEHKVILDALRERAAAGRIDLHLARVDEHGRVSPESLAEVLTPETALVAIILTNNELGTLNPISALAPIIRDRSPRAHFHVDAVQAAGRVPVSFRELGTDTMAIAAHKFRGPKGVGGVFISPHVSIRRQIPGGGQERHLRAGTENIAGAASMAAALTAAIASMPAHMAAAADARESLWTQIADAIPSALRNTPLAETAPGALNVSFPGRDGRALVRLLDEAGFAISAGSACTSEGEAISHVLEATSPQDPARVRGAIRISFLNAPPASDLQRFVRALAEAVAKEG